MSAAKPPSGSPVQQRDGSTAAGLDDAVTLVNSTTVRVRPIDLGDADALAVMFARLTPESRRRRFLSSKGDLSPRELTYFTDVDHVNHEAIVAIDEQCGTIVGEARYASLPGLAGIADFAIVVSDELQHMRLGTGLAAQLVERARVNGMTRLTATTSWENAPARALLWRLGFYARASAGHEIELELVVPRARVRAGGRALP
jgi:RimJ/RimL family protein N-acetyltransferase